MADVAGSLIRTLKWFTQITLHPVHLPWVIINDSCDENDKMGYRADHTIRSKPNLPAVASPRVPSSSQCSRKHADQDITTQPSQPAAARPAVQSLVRQPASLASQPFTLSGILRNAASLAP